MPLPVRRRDTAPQPTARWNPFSELEGLEMGLASAELQILCGLEESERLVFRTLLQRVAVNADSVEHLKSACSVAEELGVIHEA